MVFTTEYKQQAFDVLQHNQYCGKIMEALEKNDTVSYRFLIEVIIDDLELNLRPRILIDWGEALVWNSQVNYWFSLNKLYAEFMDEFINEIPDFNTYVNKEEDESEDSLS